MLISDEVEFSTKKTTRDQEGLYIMLKGSVHQKDIMILNVCINQQNLKIREAKTYKAEIYEFKIMLGKYIISLVSKIKQQDLVYMY